MWDVLGIAPTQDEKAIRRAYAARLRALDPDKDPAGFQRLRAAYEGALRMRARPQTVVSHAAPDPAPAPERPAAELPPEQRERIAEDRERQEAAREINEALQQKNPRRALERFEGSLARGLIRLGEREYVLEGIMRTVVADQTIASQDFVDLVGLAGWSQMPRLYETVTQSRMPALQRAEAERWYLALRKRADESLRWGQYGLDERRDIHGARLVADGTWFAHVTTSGFRPARKWTEQARKYAPAIGFRFPPGRIERAETLVKRERLWRKLRVGAINTVKAAFLLMLIGAGIASAGTGLIFLWFLIGRFGFKGYFSSWKD